MAQRARRYTHVVWDWNGTLLDDAWLCVDVMNEVLAARNMPALTVERYQAIFDFPVIRYYERIGFDLEREPFEVVGTEFIQRYEARRTEANLRPEARAVLGALRETGVRQSVLSAYRQDTLDSLLRHHAVDAYFHDITGSDDHYARGKTEQGRALLKRLRVDPSCVLLVGDTAHDHEVAQAMGVDCLLLPGGTHTAERLSSCGAPVIRDLQDVVAHVRSSG